MKTQIHLPVIFILLSLGFSCSLFSQPGTITLTFSGDLNGEAVSIDSAWVKNLSQNCDTSLYPPDLSLALEINTTGIAGASNAILDFTVSQNVPNPFIDRTFFSVQLPGDGSLEIHVSNLQGQQRAFYAGQGQQGISSFEFCPGPENVYILTVKYRNETRSIRMLSAGNGNSSGCSLNYQGKSESANFKSVQLNNYFSYTAGDLLLFVGYAAQGESGMPDSPMESKDYVFQYATNMACIESPTVTYEGQTYATIQVFSQCWMKENLNVGTMINAPQYQTNNTIIEKYCLANDPASCATYGGVYMWEELMQYSLDEATQGICPPGWHVPSDMDWQVLEGAVDSQYGIGHPQWNVNGERGLDAGKNLKSTTGWYGGGNGIDLFDFTAIPGGFYYVGGGGGWAGGSLFATFYTSSHHVAGAVTRPYHRSLSWIWNEISRGYDYKENARPVRCIKNL